MQDIITSDRKKMNPQEVKKLLNFIQNNNLPKNFNRDQMRIECNTRSGCHFITNDDCEVLVFNPVFNKPEFWFITPYNGVEGFFEDLVGCYLGMHEDDQDYMKQIAKNENKEDILEPFVLQMEAIKDQEALDELDAELGL